MELIGYWKVLRKRWWLIFLLVVFGGGAAFYQTSQQVPLYSATTTLFINPTQVSPLLPDEYVAFATNRQIEFLASTYTRLIETRSFVELVSEQLDGTATPGEVGGALSSSYVLDTQFFTISAIHPDPELAADIANTAGEVLLARELQRQQRQDEQAVESDPNLQAQIARLEELETSLEAEIEYYNSEIADIETQIADVESNAPTTENRRELNELQSELLDLRYVRIDVQTRLTETLAQRSSLTPTRETPETAVVVDIALVSDAPIPTNDLQRILLAMLVGGVVGVGLAFLLEYLDYTIKTPEQLEEIYGMPVQGVIGLTDRKLFKQPGELPAALATSNSPIAESFRVLRTGLQVTRMTSNIRTLLITSSGPGEGKTFVASNLAASLASAGVRVILVDTDLRKPRLHQMFGLQRGIGFTNLVVNRENALEQALQPTAMRNLRILTCGTIPPNPAELLSSPRTEDVMCELLEQADIIIYDSPPAATVTDASIIAQRVDAVLPVVWAGRTRTHLVLRCKSVLENVGANILGPVLNQVQLSDLGSYAYYYYGYYHDESGLFSSSKKRRRNGSQGQPQTQQNGNGTHEANGTISEETIGSDREQQS